MSKENPECQEEADYWQSHEADYEEPHNEYIGDNEPDCPEDFKKVEQPKTLAEEINELFDKQMSPIMRVEIFKLLRNHNKRIKAIFEDVGNTFDWTIEERNALNEEISKISGEL